MHKSTKYPFFVLSYSSLFMILQNENIALRHMFELKRMHEDRFRML